MSIEMSARRYAIDGDAERVNPHATVTGSSDSVLYPVSTESTCGLSLMIAVNAGMIGMVAAAAFAMVEVVAHLVS